MMKRHHRYDAAPLFMHVALTADRLPPQFTGALGECAGDMWPHLSVSDLASLLAVSARTIHRYHRHGIPERSLDRIATAYGLHPHELRHKEPLNA